MIEHWPWYLSGLALAAVPVVHWLALGRNLAVSGRVTAIVNRLRFGKTEDDEGEVSEDELLAALREATIAALGAEAVEAATSPGSGSSSGSGSGSGPKVSLPPRQSVFTHFVFLIAMVGGGALSAFLAGAWEPSFALTGKTFNALFGGSMGLTVGVLVGGGFLVGFGTRMAAGCTTGHGLCGVSRFQKGSLAATAAFFGSAVVTSFLLKVIA